MRNRIIIFLSVVFFAGILVSLPLASQEEKHDHSNHEEISGKHNGPDGEVENEHKEHADHDSHDDHVESGHGEHEDETTDETGREDGELILSDEQKQEIGIKTELASSGKLHSELTLTGELMLNEDAVAHIIPRVQGVAVKVNFTFGDMVKKGDVLAVLESAELGESLSDYMASRKVYERKRKLYEEKIASQNDYLEALNRFEQVTADLYIKIGKEKYLQAAKMYESRYTPGNTEPGQPLPLNDSLAFVENTTRYEITAPISGTIIEKHITRGEKVGDDVNVFTIADLKTVWVNLKVPTRDISLIHPGMSVVIESQDKLQTEGKVTMISPIVDADTRAATARISIENHQGDWMPGAFVTGSIRVSDENIPLVIPRNAVQNFEGKDVVFLADDHGFTHVPVVIGRHDRENVEILSGLQVGQLIVTHGAFELKAILLTSGMDSHAGHGH
ncbi:MAG: efflux RND transporter periplasmic adaptor subunit [Pseudomonadota bacterium]